MGIIFELDRYCSYVFENERWFIKKFFPEYIGSQLVSFHMSPENCLVSMLLDSGETILTDIDTIAFINWIK